MDNCGWVKNGGKCILEQENKELKDNWNKLKEWLEEEYERCDKIGNPAIGCAMGQIKRIKNKMQEIEGGMNDR